MTVRSVRPTFDVSDIRESLAWFEQLGRKTTFDGHGERGHPGGHTFRVGAFRSG